MSRFNIQWQCTSTSYLQGSCLVERVIENLERALHKVTRSEFKECNASLENVLYEYRRRKGPDEVAPFALLVGVKPSFAVEFFDAIPGEEAYANDRTFKLAREVKNHIKRLVPRGMRKELRYQIGYMAL